MRPFKTHQVALIMVAACLVIVPLADAQWAADGGTTVRNSFGPGGSMCRGACGADCPPTCERWVIHECVDNETYRSVRVFECGTHHGCRVHDDCIDRCTVRDPESTQGADFYYDRCPLSCHAEAQGIGLADDQLGVDEQIKGPIDWSRGDGPKDGSIIFEYTKASPEGEEFLFRCPDGMQLECPVSGQPSCQPKEEEPAEEDDDAEPGPLVAGIFAGPTGACVEPGEPLQLYAELFGLDDGRVEWAVEGSGRVDRNGVLTSSKKGTVTLTARSVVEPIFADKVEVQVGGCDCMVSAILSGDTAKTYVSGGMAHFSTSGRATVRGAFSNPGMIEQVAGRLGAAGEEVQNRAKEFAAQAAAMPQETLGISLAEFKPGSEEAALKAFGSFTLQASVMDQPIEPGFAGGLNLSHLLVMPGDWGTSQAVRYEWIPGSEGSAFLTVTQYTGHSLAGTITADLVGRNVADKNGASPRLSLSVSFHALDFDPLNMELGCLDQ